VKKFLRFCLFAGTFLVALAAIVLSLMYFGSQQVPEFYQQALVIPAEEQVEEGEQFERRVTDLANDIRRPGRWQAIFTDAEMNGFLANDLKKAIPDGLPHGLSDPRVAVRDGYLLVGCKHEAEWGQTVLNLQAEMYLTEEPNVVAVRIHRLRSGAVPLPLKRMMDDVTDTLHKQGVPVRWLEQENDPVALIHVPRNHPRLRGDLHIDTLELREGEIYLSGENRQDKSNKEAVTQRRATSRATAPKERR